MGTTTPYLGIIEGFFGRAWSYVERQDYAAFLREHAYHFYIYAPKNDQYLRKAWRQDWPTETAAQLQQLISHYQQQGLDFGVGLSPYEIYKDYNESARRDLQQKVKRLNKLGVNILCLLFDDMRGDVPNLAQTQIEICRDVAAETQANRVILCPTYYSFDPALEKFFGRMPEYYWPTLGRDLPADIDLFWTGPKICSSKYPASHMQEVADLLGRKPFLWDNYPVNDGESISNFLHLKAFENRPAVLAEQCSGHAANPMNQPWLSRIPLHSLPRSYALAHAYQPGQAFEEALHELCERGLAKQISRDIDFFQGQGLSGLDPEKRQQLIRKYTVYNSPYAQEIIAWLKDEYAFDPNCLTGITGG